MKQRSDSLSGMLAPAPVHEAGRMSSLASHAVVTRSGALNQSGDAPTQSGFVPTQKGSAPTQGGSAPTHAAVGEHLRNAAPDGETGLPIQLLRHGRLPYTAGLQLQNDLVVKRRAREVPDTLVLLEHDAVVTLGRGADRSHVLLDRTMLAARGVELHETGRGGDVTIHSPGQVVGYPILALEGARRDTHRYLRDLEEVMIRAAADFGVRAVRIPGMTGIWAGTEKLGAIGVRLNSGWITSHGFAFSVANDLSLFNLIVPCGIVGRGVTSLSRLLGRTIAVADAMDCLASRFLEIFGDDPAGLLSESAPARGEKQPTGNAQGQGTVFRHAAFHGRGQAASRVMEVLASQREHGAIREGGIVSASAQEISARRDEPPGELCANRFETFQAAGAELRRSDPDLVGQDASDPACTGRTER